MNWLSDFVRPKIKKTAQKEIADDLWLKCPDCGKLLFSKELKKTWYVCPECDYHLRLYLDIYGFLIRVFIHHHLHMRKHLRVQVLLEWHF